MDETLTLAQLEEMAADIRWLRANESDDYRAKESSAVEYARERAARERCMALLRPNEGVTFDCNLIDFEVAAYDTDDLPGDIIRAHGDTATEAWLALGDALEKR